MIKLIAGDFTLDAAAGDTPSRTISGIAVPYNVEAVVSDGTAVIFRPGSLPVEGKAPRLFMYHNASMPVGIVTERVDTDEGMMFTARISKTTLGDDALVMALDGTIDQVSVGVNPTKFAYDDEGNMIIEAADWMELSLVPIGAFGDAAPITEVAASIHQEPEEVVLNEEVTPVEEKPEMSEVTETAVEATIPTAPVFAQAKRVFDLPTPGEYLAAMHIGGETFRNVAAAAGEGAQVVVDGRDGAPTEGFFLKPSLIDHAKPGMKCYDDEIFGPVLTVVRVKSYEEGLQLINDNQFGNGTAIFTRDGGVARQFQFDVNVGMVGINVPIPVPVSYYSFGGWKASLFGDLHMYGPDGIQFYTRSKVVTSRWPDPRTSKVDLGFPQNR